MKVARVLYDYYGIKQVFVLECSYLTALPLLLIYIMAVAEIAEAINAGGTLKALPEGTLLHTQLQKF